MTGVLTRRVIVGARCRGGRIDVPVDTVGSGLQEAVQGAVA